MDAKRVLQIKKELNDCMVLGTGLSQDSIEDLLKVLDGIYIPKEKAQTAKDTTPMIGLNPFKKDQSASDVVVANKDINQSLNYRVSKFNDFE